MMFRHTARFASMLALSSALLLATACGAAEDDGSSPGQEEQEEMETQPFEVVVERDNAVADEDIDYEAVRELSAVNTDAAFRFYRKLRAEADGEGLVFSPLSISRAFSNYYTPEHSEAAAFEALFGFTADTASEPAWRSLSWLAMDRSGYDLEDDARSVFESSDIYWVDEKLGNTGNFDRVHKLPIQADPDSARQIINDWIEERSYGLLVDFLDPGLVNSLTEAVTTNVVYFRGVWKHELRDKGTMSFEAASGASEVPAFGGTFETSAVATDELVVVSVPYTMNYNLWIMMPTGSLDDFADELDAARFNEAIGSTRPYEVTLTAPKFQKDSNPDIVKAIEELREETGTAGGTLSGAYRETYVHKAVIKVDEEGTEASAATAIIEYANGVPEPPEPLTVELDRPFVYVITDPFTDSILFMGEHTGK